MAAKNAAIIVVRLIFERRQTAVSGWQIGSRQIANDVSKENTVTIY